MKKKITISAVLLFITLMSFAQSANTDLVQNYSYTGNSGNVNGSGLSRLKMMDQDNLTIYSSAQSVKEEKPVSIKNEIEIFPGLAHWNQKIMIINLREPSNIRIFDYAGRLIQKLSSTANSIQISNLEKGNYFVNIIGMQTGSSSVKKLSIIN